MLVRLAHFVYHQGWPKLDYSLGSSHKKTWQAWVRYHWKFRLDYTNEPHDLYIEIDNMMLMTEHAQREGRMIICLRGSEE